MMALKNYASQSAIPNIFGDIQKTLINHGAKQIMYDYEGDKITSLTFRIDTNKGEMWIKLPARVDRVKKIFDNQGLRYKSEQPYRTAWATIRDWVSSQMALIDWDMVKMEEVFLPYARTRSGQTYFEVQEKRGFLLEDTDDK